MSFETSNFTGVKICIQMAIFQHIRPIALENWKFGQIQKKTPFCFLENSVLKLYWSAMTKPDRLSARFFLLDHNGGT